MVSPGEWVLQQAREVGKYKRSLRHTETMSGRGEGEVRGGSSLELGWASQLSSLASVSSSVKWDDNSTSLSGLVEVLL